MSEKENLYIIEIKKILEKNDFSNFSICIIKQKSVYFCKIIDLSDGRVIASTNSKTKYFAIESALILIRKNYGTRGL
jgi:hypothetical protein